MRKIVTMKLDVLSFTWPKDSSLETIVLESRLSSTLFTLKWSPDADTSVILTRNSIFLSFLQVRFFRPPGMERWFSSDVSQSLRSIAPTLFQLQLFSIKSQRPQFPMLVTLQFFAAQLFVLIWVAFQSHISELMEVGFAFVTDLFTINSEEWDRDQPLLTFHSLTTRCTDQSFVLRRCSTLTSHPFSSMFEQKYKLMRIL